MGTVMCACEQHCDAQQQKKIQSQKRVVVKMATILPPPPKKSGLTLTKTHVPTLFIKTLLLVQGGLLYPTRARRTSDALYKCHQCTLITPQIDCCLPNRKVIFGWSTINRYQTKVHSTQWIKLDTSGTWADVNKVIVIGLPQLPYKATNYGLFLSHWTKFCHKVRSKGTKRLPDLEWVRDEGGLRGDGVTRFQDRLVACGAREYIISPPSSPSAAVPSIALWYCAGEGGIPSHP